MTHFASRIFNFNGEPCVSKLTNLRSFCYTHLVSPKWVNSILNIFRVKLFKLGGFLSNNRIITFYQFGETEIISYHSGILEGFIKSDS